VEPHSLVVTSAGPLVEFAVLVSPTLKPGTGLPAEQIGAPDRLRRMAQDDIIDLIRLSAVLTSDASGLRREGLCWGLPTVQTKMGEVWMVPPFKRTADASPSAGRVQCGQNRQSSARG
jgi:hypothetical protein